MTSADLVNMYEFSYAVLNHNLQDVTEEESLVKPPTGGNCLNWVVGHIVTHRDIILGIIGEEAVLTEAQSAPYRRGSAPTAGDALLDMATLRGFLSDSQHRLLPALAQLSDDQLQATVPEKFYRSPLKGSVGNALIRLHYHEGYHNGQIGLLRRVAGKEGAIR